MSYAEDVIRLAVGGGTDALLERIGDRRVVMIGEATHGTHEFYRWRAEITKRLIAGYGFSFVGVEGDWPDCARIDRSVRCHDDGLSDPRAALTLFERWPTWMWANEEVADFCRWLRWHNAAREPEARVGFHGLDIYSLWESLREILDHLRRSAPDALAEAASAFRCFQPFGEDPQRYAMATRFVPASCEDEVVSLLARLRSEAGADFAAVQNAEVVAGAEAYYRAMVRGGPDSWNVRDRHMDATLARLLAHYGAGAKAVVWAHNTHVGDERGSDMAAAGEVTIGGLARARFGADQVALIGVAGGPGTVIAGRSWGGAAEELPVPAGREGSLEGILARHAPPEAVLPFPPDDPPALLTDPIPHRAIGVVYRPEREPFGNYVPTVLADRYDHLAWFATTRGVRPLHTLHSDVHELEAYPSGV
ncbi:erythromycin esterase family protein [Catenuloplanes atrovinosus]|uniref:Erythromycin esterase-like protein n=1 Tax=Catenuloplanes atrovinosus TaxID=137266 RepID=A0AAE3YIZ4_9ACTN|nr:erythromycin esterase family protein [Catenuloplanes atrovinosus]MDR7274703.1 erythromycin esterase-like protein [Catenuloplanes atrovinosus]